MQDRRRKQAPRRLLGALILLLLLAAMLPLGVFLAGLLPGGGRLRSPEKPVRGPPEGGLEVTVVRASDTSPVEGATVKIEGGAGSGDGRSDAAGRVVFHGLGAGPFRIEAVHGTNRAVAWADPRVETRLELALAPERTREGTVRHADGTPARARVALLDAEGNELEVAPTDAHGRYTLPERDDAVAVCAAADRGAPATVAQGDVTLPEGVRLKGRLLGSGGGEILVYGRMPSPSEDTTLPWRATWKVEADGSFEGRLPANAEAWGVHGGRPFRLASGELALPRKAVAKGRVSGTAGEAAPRATLRFRPMLDGEMPAPLPPVLVVADGNGAFEAELAAVRYAVLVRAPGFAARLFDDVGVEPGADPLRFELDAGYELHGFVTDAAGLPVQGARVQGVGLPQVVDRPIAEAVADGLGRFKLSGLGGRTARVRVTAPGCYPTTMENVAPEGTLRIVLQRR